MQLLDELVQQISRFPGIGKKSAMRIAFFLLKSPSGFNQNLAKSIAELQERIRPCSICGNFSEQDICNICSNPKRDSHIVCVVEQAQDIYKIESTQEFKGRFHVLNGVLSPLDGIGAKELRLPELYKRLEEENIGEIIVATNPTPEGDATGLYISYSLREKDIVVTRLAMGLPVGGDMEYVDQLSLAHSLRSRMPISGKENSW